ncbi:MAG: PHA/PHB synthase family protein [Paracoccaceae bacterium]
MTTDETPNAPDLSQLNANLAKIEALSQRLVAAIGQKKEVESSLQSPGQDLFMKAASSYMNEMMANPAKLLEHQVSYWGKTLQHFSQAQEMLAAGKFEAPVDETVADKRFSDPMWTTHPYFNYVKQQYLFNSEAVSNAVDGIEGLDSADKKRLEFFSGQILEMMSPANFLGTNPEALTRAMETDGQSLVDGLENLVRDIEANDGELVLTLADKSAFDVGKNLATTKGSVVFRNRMFELIQYAPATDTVFKRPLIIFPPWINKFYILDLKEKNSLIKWIVDQGFTLFVVSWVNPDASYADVGMEEYVQEGYLTAIDAVKKITGEKKVNAVGYCIGGTTLGLTLSLMKKRNDTSIASATFFTTLTDFSDQGEVGVFLSNDFVDGIEREVAAKGILHSFFMSRTFSYLRSNDLIYKPAIRSYLMGEAPPAFDLLYWNGDGTNLPAKMTIEYLRGLCQDDLFAKGRFPQFGETLSLADVTVPLCAIACETDHIAGWKSSYDGVRQMGSADKTFILSESGHVAGIVNPPSKKKYGHYTNADLNLDHDDWKSGADFTKGSWWPRWGDWLAKRSGKQVPARLPGDSSHPVLCDAPGTYVVAVPKD